MRPTGLNREVGPWYGSRLPRCDTMSLGKALPCMNTLSTQGLMGTWLDSDCLTVCLNSFQYRDGRRAVYSPLVLERTGAITRQNVKTVIIQPLAAKLSYVPSNK